MLHVEEDRETDADGAPLEGAPSKPTHRTRVVWNEELHGRFLAAIEVAGCLDAAVPTVILKVCS